MDRKVCKPCGRNAPHVTGISVFVYVICNIGNTGGCVPAIILYRSDQPRGVRRQLRLAIEVLELTSGMRKNFPLPGPPPGNIFRRHQACRRSGRFVFFLSSTNLLPGWSEWYSGFVSCSNPQPSNSLSFGLCGKLSVPCYILMIQTSCAN